MACATPRLTTDRDPWLCVGCLELEEHPAIDQSSILIDDSDRQQTTKQTERPPSRQSARIASVPSRRNSRLNSTEHERVSPSGSSVAVAESALRAAERPNSRASNSLPSSHSLFRLARRPSPEVIDLLDDSNDETETRARPAPVCASRSAGACASTRRTSNSSTTGTPKSNKRARLDSIGSTTICSVSPIRVVGHTSKRDGDANTRARRLASDLESENNAPLNNLVRERTTNAGAHDARSRSPVKEADGRRRPLHTSPMNCAKDEDRPSGSQRVQPSREAKQKKKRYRDKKKRKRTAYRPHVETVHEVSHEEEKQGVVDNGSDAGPDSGSDSDSSSDSDTESVASVAISSVVSLDEAAEIDIPSADEDEEDGPDAASLRHQVPVSHCSNSSRNTKRPRGGATPRGRPSRKMANLTVA